MDLKFGTTVYLCVCGPLFIQYVWYLVWVFVCVFFLFQILCSQDESRKEMEEKYSFSSASHNLSVCIKSIAMSLSLSF